MDSVNNFDDVGVLDVAQNLVLLTPMLGVYLLDHHLLIAVHQLRQKDVPELSRADFLYYLKLVSKH